MKCMLWMGKSGLLFLTPFFLFSLIVNVYLWRSALETLSFMPLNSADPIGGTILTNLHTELDYNFLKSNLPNNILPAYDGMRLKI